MEDADGLAIWLERHGLAALAPRLAGHDIDLKLLRQLTEPDLMAAGLSLGQRRRLAQAIEAESGERPMVPRAERRRLTVLYVDLVGSTALSGRLDAEELHELIRTFQNAIAGEVGRFAGHLAKFLGDGALVYFGWPIAHEDDAERAVRCARAVLDAVGRIRVQDGGLLAARAGIATGSVVVEDGSGSGAGAETGIAGETPNLAARLQTLAAPGEVIMAEATLRLVSGLFEVAALQPQALKGFAEPQPAHRIVDERRIETRFEARHEHAPLSPMVGRDAELAQLADAWSRAEAGDGNIVLLVGDAGLGKSRLVQSLGRRLHDRPHVRLRYQCSPFHDTTALWPVTEQLVHAAGLQGEADPARRLERLRAVLDRGGVDPATHLPPVAHLLGLADATDPVAALAPAERKRRLFGALLAQLAGLAGHTPVLLVLEDAHWIDPTTSELFELTFAAVAGLRVLVVATFRPEGRPPWVSLPHAAELALRPLASAEAGAIVTQVAPGLSPQVVQGIIDRADGIPLFIEEVARSIAESAPSRPGREASTVPASLHDTLMARLDRIDGARHVAQVGAAIGRVFTPALLQRCIDLPPDRLHAALANLVASGLVIRRGSGNELAYVFKHALVQDAAYETLLRSQRREIHGRIADTLAAEREHAPELLARHLTAAGRTDAAILAWRAAAQQAVMRSANREAAHHLGRALDLLASSPDAATRGPAELALRLELAVSLIAVHGFGSDQVAGCAAQARDLAERVGDDLQRFAALRLVWNSTLMREPLPGVVALAEELTRRADVAADPARQAVAQRALGYSLCMSGRHREALQAFERGIALADGIGDSSFTIYGEHPGIVCRFYSAWSLALFGDTAASDRRGDEAVAMARAVGTPHGLTWALVCAGVPALFTDNPERAHALEGEALSIAETYRLPQWTGFASNYLGWALLAAGSLERAFAAATRGLDLVRGTGAVLNTTILLWTRAQCRLAVGDAVGAATDVDAALAHADSHGENVIQPGLQWLEGEIARALGGDPVPFWRRARELAERQGTIIWRRRLDRSIMSLCIGEIES